jgi:exopolysaccharide production protein ExoQ
VSLSGRLAGERAAAPQVALAVAERGDPALRATWLAFGLAGPLIYLTPLGAAVLVPVLCLLALVHAWRSRTLDRMAIGRSLWPAGVFATYATLTALWAIVPGNAVFEGVRLLGEAAIIAALWSVATALPRDHRETALVALAAGYAVISPFIVLDAELAGRLTAWARVHAPTDITIANSYSRGAIVHALLLIPLALGLIRHGRPRLAAIFTILGLAPILLLHNSSAKSALAIGVAAALAAFLWAGMGRVMIVAAAALTVLLPLAFPLPTEGPVACWLAATKSSAVHRMHIWNFAAQNITQRPLFGWGMDAARSLPGGNTHVEIHLCTSDGSPGALVGQGTLMSLHPHNAILQIWLELGGIGALAAAALLLWYGLRFFAGAADRLARAALAASWGAAFTSASVSFGIWQSWWIASLGFVFLVTHLAAMSDAAPRPHAPQA